MKFQAPIAATGLIILPVLSVLPSPSHFSTPLLVFTSQINYLLSSPCSRVCSWRNAKIEDGNGRYRRWEYASYRLGDAQGPTGNLMCFMSSGFAPGGKTWLSRIPKEALSGEGIEGGCPGLEPLIDVRESQQWKSKQLQLPLWHSSPCPLYHLQCYFFLTCCVIAGDFFFFSSCLKNIHSLLGHVKSSFKTQLPSPSAAAHAFSVGAPPYCTDWLCCTLLSPNAPSQPVKVRKAGAVFIPESSPSAQAFSMLH